MMAALITSISMSRPATGRIWIVSSRSTSACHSVAAARTSMTEPVASEARNVMMATTATSARPKIVACGTIGLSTRDSIDGESAPCASALRSMSPFTSVVDMQTTLVQHKATRVYLIHKRDIVGGNHDGSPRLVEFDEQAQQPLRQIRIDVAGRLVGEEELWPRDHRA